MKNFNNCSTGGIPLRNGFFIPLFTGLIIFLASCSTSPEPYSIIDITGVKEVFNYSKSYPLPAYYPDSLNPAAIMASRGDLLICDEKFFLYNGNSSQNRLVFKNLDDSVGYVNDKIVNIEIPDNDKMIPWFENMNQMDFSALQYISFDSKMPESYIPYLKKLAEIKSDAGFFYEGNLEYITQILKIFNPKIIVGLSLRQSDYGILSGLSNLELLMASLKDSVITDPLPALPSLKQIFLQVNKNCVLTNDLLSNNRQIEKVKFETEGSFDFSMLKSLGNLKELVVSGSGAILNFDQINEHTKVEILVLQVDGMAVNPDLIKLPSLRWMTVYDYVTQEEFNSFIDAHPNLEVIELIQNDTISSLRALSKLSKLYGLTITDTVTDIAAIKTLTNLKYLSLPDDFLKDSVNKADLQKSLPGTRIVANVPFCLGSGWLLLLIPLVLIIRFLASRKNKDFGMR